MWDIIKHMDICVRVILGEKKVRKAHEKIFKEIMIENFPNVLKNGKVHI